MRIFMISHAYPPTVSGVTVIVQRLAREMVRRGHSVTVLCGTDRDESYRTVDDGVQLIRIKGVSNPWWKETCIPMISAKDLQDLLDEVQPDIVHEHEAGFPALTLLRIKSQLSAPILATSYYVPRFVARYLTIDDEPHNLVESIARSYTMWVFNRFDHVVFGTRAHRDSFVNAGLTSPTTVISNGIDTTRYHPGDGRDEGVEDRYGLPPRPRILFVSRLAKDKEIDVLVRAMPRLSSECKAHLILIGKGDDQERLEGLVAKMNLENSVLFLGFVPEVDLPAVFRACDLFVHASPYEVQSLPALQAAASALPLVLVRAMALPELVQDGVNGHLFPVADDCALAEAAARILQDPEMAARMGRESVEVAKPHALHYTYDQYEALYSRLVDGNTRPPA